MTENKDFDEFLSRSLRNTQPYLMDDGFTANVMKKIPVSTRRRKRREWFYVGMPAAVITLLVVWQLPPVSHVWQWLTLADLGTLLKMGASGFGAVLLACFGWLARDMKLV
jgi:hypothetical protein